MAAPAIIIKQVHYKIGNNDNADPDSCSFDTLDTRRGTQPLETPFMVRIQLINAGDGSDRAEVDLYYNDTNNVGTAVQVGVALNGSVQIDSADGLPADGVATNVDDVVFDNTGLWNWQNGIYDDQDGSVGKYELLGIGYTDLQFCVQFTDLAQDGITYYFYIKVGSTVIDTYTKVAQVTSRGFIEQALYSLLSNDGGVSALVSTRIYPNILEQGTVMPAMTYEQTDGTRDEVMTAPTGFVDSSFQITYWSGLYSEVRAVAAAVEALLDGYSGTVFGVEIEAIHLVDEADIPIMPAGKDVIKRYGKRQDFTVWFKEVV